MQLEEFLEPGMSPGKMVRRNREEMGITLKEYGEMCDVSFQAVHMWENGKNNVPGEVVYDIVKDAIYDHMKENHA